MGAGMDRGKVTEEQLDEHAKKLIDKLNRISYRAELEENAQIATGRRLEQLNQISKLVWRQ